MLEDADRAASDSVLLLSPDFTILWANTVALKETGYALEEISGKRCYEVTHLLESPCEPPLHPCPVSDLLRTGEPVTATHTHSDRRGENVIVEVRAYPIMDEAAVLTRIVHVSSDVTKNRRVEEALRGAREALENRVERQLQRRNVYGLTFRELTVLRLVASGRSDREIATILGIRPLTAQKHVSNILAKMRAASRTDAAVRAVMEGLVY